MRKEHADKLIVPNAIANMCNLSVAAAFDLSLPMYDPANQEGISRA
jgi:hypothetical protein